MGTVTTSKGLVYPDGNAAFDPQGDIAALAIKVDDLMRSVAENKQVFQANFSGTIGNNSVWGMQGLTVNNSATVNSPVTIDGEKLIVSVAGWYDVSLRYQQTVADSTGGYAGLNFGGADVWANNLSGGARANPSVASYYLSVGQAITAQFVQISGAPRNFFGAITVRKVA